MITKHDATNVAKEIIAMEKELKELKAEYGIADLEKRIASQRKILDKFTGKQNCDLFEGLKVIYTKVSNFSRDLLHEAYPEINLSQYYVESSRFKEITKEA